MEELKKDIDSKLFFCIEWSPWKVLEFSVEKRVRTLWVYHFYNWSWKWWMWYNWESIMLATCTRESIGRHPCRGNSSVFLQGRPASKWQQDELLPRRMKSNIEASCRDIQRNTEVPKSRRSLALFSIGYGPLLLLFVYCFLTQTWRERGMRRLLAVFSYINYSSLNL